MSYKSIPQNHQVQNKQNLYNVDVDFPVREREKSKNLLAFM